MRAVLPAQEVIGFCSFLVNCVCWYMGVDVRCFFVCACGRKGESPIRQKVQQRESCIVGCNGMQSVEEMAIKNGPGWRSVAKGALSANAVYIKIYVKQVYEELFQQFRKFHTINWGLPMHSPPV